MWLGAAGAAVGFLIAFAGVRLLVRFGPETLPRLGEVRLDWLWERNLDDARVGSPKLLAAMQAPTILTDGKTSAYGFGLAIGQCRGQRTIEHAGSDRGVAANLVRYPDQGLAIALLCNLDTIEWIGLTQRVADIYLADVLAPPSSNAGISPAPRATLSADELASRRACIASH